MSSHSSDVCIIEDTEDSLSNPSLPPPVGLFRSDASTPLENTAPSRDFVDNPVMTPLRVCATGVNTDFPPSGDVNALLEDGIMSLMRTMGGDAFAQHLFLNSRRNYSHRSSTAAVADVSRVVQGLRRITSTETATLPTKLSLPQGTAMMPQIKMEPSIETPTCSTTSTQLSELPEWLPQLQESMSSTNALLRDVLSHAAPHAPVDVVPCMTPPHPQLAPPLLSSDTAAAAEPQRMPPPVVSSTLHDSDRSSADWRVAALEAEIRQLHEVCAEARVILEREGRRSGLLALYKELLQLRRTRRQTAARDAEATTAVLSATERLFVRELTLADRRRQRAEEEIATRSEIKAIGRHSPAVAMLVADVERLSELRVELDRLRAALPTRSSPLDETVAVMNDAESAAEVCVDAVVGVKRPRDDGGPVAKLLEQHAALLQETHALRHELSAQCRKTEDYRHRYETAIRTMPPPQENPVFQSLLQGAEDLQRVTAIQQATRLCRLFGWELLELNESSVALARAGSNEHLTLPLPNEKADSRASMATSIVLARKVLDNRAIMQQGGAQMQSRPESQQVQEHPKNEQQQQQQQQQQQLQKEEQEVQEEPKHHRQAEDENEESVEKQKPVSPSGKQMEGGVNEESHESQSGGKDNEEQDDNEGMNGDEDCEEITMDNSNAEEDVEGAKLENATGEGNDGSTTPMESSLHSRSSTPIPADSHEIPANAVETSEEALPPPANETEEHKPEPSFYNDSGLWDE